MHKKKESIILVDICGTLYNSNTTFDFLDFYLKKDKSYLFFRKFSKSLIWRSLNKIVMLLAKVDVTRFIAVKYLKGKSQAELDKAMDEFYINLVNLKYNNIWDFVLKWQLSGYRLILVSATLDFIAKKIGREIGVKEVIYTELEYDRDRNCLGKIKHDLLGRKLQRLKDSNILKPFYLTITDNLSDIDLITSSKKAIIVSNSKTSKDWYSILTNYNIKDFELINV